jgi:hypothetical protein
MNAITNINESAVKQKNIDSLNLESLTIFSDNSISIGSTMTGYSVAQTPTGTKVFKNHNNGYPFLKDLGQVVAMPKSRYTLSTLSGLAEFGIDFFKIWNVARCIGHDA